MVKSTDHLRLRRVVAFLWGFTFILLYRYALDSLYPFWARQLRLSLFATLVALIVFISFWWHFHYHKIKKRRGTAFTLFVVLNSAVLFAALAFTESYQFIFPVYFGLQVILQLFLFGAKLPFFIPDRFFLLIGIITGILPIPVLQDPRLVFGLTTVLAIFPNRFLHEAKLKIPKNKVRMLPFRQTLDFLRFIFLGAAIFGLFDPDMNRSVFYPIATILVVTSLIQVLLFKVDRSKHHIRLGLRMLAFTFLMIGLAYTYFQLNPAKTQFSFLMAFSYTILVFWEALYFKKVVEGYLHREQVIAGCVLSFYIAAYFVTYDWLKIILGIIIVICQIRIVAYVFKKYRWITGVFFAISLAIWSYGLLLGYESSYRSEFWVKGHGHAGNPEHPPIHWLTHFQKGVKLRTDAYPKEVIEAVASRQSYFQSIEFESRPVGFFTIYYNDSDPSTVHLFSKRRLYPYNLEEPWAALKQHLEVKQLNQFYFFLSNVREGLLENYEGPVTIKKTSKKENDKIEFQILLGIKLANYYEKKLKFVRASKVYDQLIKYAKTDPQILLGAANSAKLVSRLEDQIQYLKQYLKLTKDNKVKVLRQLLEIYVSQRKYSKAVKTVNLLIREDQDRILSYMRWLYKIYSDEGVKSRWYSLRSRVNRWRVKKNEPLYQKRKEFLRRVKAKIREVELHHFVKDITSRQETIQFPEN